MILWLQVIASANLLGTGRSTGAARTLCLHCARFPCIAQVGQLGSSGNCFHKHCSESSPSMCFRKFGASIRLETRPSSACRPHHRHDLHLLSFLRAQVAPLIHLRRYQDAQMEAKTCFSHQLQHLIRGYQDKCAGHGSLDDSALLCCPYEAWDYVLDSKCKNNQAPQRVVK